MVSFLASGVTLTWRMNKEFTVTRREAGSADPSPDSGPFSTTHIQHPHVNHLSLSLKSASHLICWFWVGSQLKLVKCFREVGIHGYGDELRVADSPVLSCSVMSDSLWPHGLACQAPPLSMGCSQQEYWGELPCPPPGGLPDPGIEPVSPASLALRLGLPLSHRENQSSQMISGSPDCRMARLSFHLVA